MVQKWVRPKKWRLYFSASRLALYFGMGPNFPVPLSYNFSAKSVEKSTTFLVELRKSFCCCCQKERNPRPAGLRQSRGGKQKSGGGETPADWVIINLFYFFNYYYFKIFFIFMKFNQKWRVRPETMNSIKNPKFPKKLKFVQKSKNGPI